MDNIKISSGTIARTVVLAIALINQILVSSGKSPLPFENEALEEFISLGFTIVASTMSWWKNNSFTKNAIKADEYAKTLKSGVVENSSTPNEDMSIDEKIDKIVDEYSSNNKE